MRGTDKNSENRRTCRNGYNVDMFGFRKKIGRHRFTGSVVNEWNKLSKHVAAAKTTESLTR